MVYYTYIVYNEYNTQYTHKERGDRTLKDIITIALQKGGTGKSTTAHALGAGLHRLGNRVLFIDLDPQANLSFTLGANIDGNTAYQVLLRKCDMKEAVQNTKNGDIISASPMLSGIDGELTYIGKEHRLKESIKEIIDDYDYIILDTPPALGILTINALTASTGVIVPAQADIYSLQGISQLQQTLEAVRTYTNPNLSLKGIVITRYSNRAILSRDLSAMIEEEAKNLDTKVYKTYIREGIVVKEAQASQCDIFSYAPNSNTAQDYTSFINEFLN